MNRLFLNFFVFGLITSFSHCIIIAQPVVSFTPTISSGLSSPIDFVNAGDGSNRVFIAEQEGNILVYNQAFNYIGNFLTVSGISTGGEQGLLSIAFSPDYETNGFFYVYYTNSLGDLELARYHVSADPNVADAASKVVVLTIPHPGETNHNGGKLNFGNDGYLYFATGDGGVNGDAPNNAQNGMVLLGKMLRIAVNNSATPPFYTIPVDNPFISDATVADEIWALGLRNPFRWSFDRLTHDMWIGDVGQGAWEEIDFTPAASTGGENYGWRCYEGNAPYNTTGCAAMPSYVFPIHVYPNPSSGPSSVTGGVVYRGTSYPLLQGYYMAIDVFSGELFLIKPNGSGGWITTAQSAAPTFIVSFGETESGEIYAVSLSGSVYAVSSNKLLPVRLLDFSVQKKDKKTAAIFWKTSLEENLLKFDIEYSYDGVNYLLAGSVPATNSPIGSSYSFEHPVSQNGKIIYRLKSIELDGSYTYSNIVMVNFSEVNTAFIFPSVITDGILQLKIKEPYNVLELIASNGTIVMQKNLNGVTGDLSVPLISISKGVYIVKLKNQVSVLSQKIVVR